MFYFFLANVWNITLIASYLYHSLKNSKKIFKCFMQKILIYITVDDRNWLKGLEYFVEEFQLGYKIIQYKTVEDVLILSDKKEDNLYAIILDWELSTIGLNKEDAISCLELTFPFIPVIALSGKEFQEHVYLSTKKNKFTTDPEELFRLIQTEILFYKHGWLRYAVNCIIYSVQIITTNINPLKNLHDVYFGHLYPLIGRQKAIEYFKNNPKSVNIVLWAYNTKQPKNISSNDFVGAFIINSSALFDREILASLNAEYNLYVENKFSIGDDEQTIQILGSKSYFKVLKGIVDVNGKTL